MRARVSSARQSALGSRRMVNSMRSPGSSRQDFDLGHVGGLGKARETSRAPFRALPRAAARRSRAGMRRAGALCSAFAERRAMSAGRRIGVHAAGKCNAECSAERVTAKCGLSPSALPPPRPRCAAKAGASAGNPAAIHASSAARMRGAERRAPWHTARDEIGGLERKYRRAPARRQARELLPGRISPRLAASASTPAARGR